MSATDKEDSEKERQSEAEAPTPSQIPSAGAQGTSQPGKRSAAHAPPQQPGYPPHYYQRGYGYPVAHPAAQYIHPTQYRPHITSTRGTSYPQQYAGRHPAAPMNYPYPATSTPTYGSVRAAYVSPPIDSRRREAGKHRPQHHRGGTSGSHPLHILNFMCVTAGASRHSPSGVFKFPARVGLHHVDRERTVEQLPLCFCLLAPGKRNHDPFSHACSFSLFNPCVHVRC